MFYGASPTLFARAKHLRLNMTIAEKLLWEELKENKLGVRFKPQHPLRFFIADFYCHQLRLTIEVDGEIHLYQNDYDNERSEIIKDLDITIIRFTNDQILNNITYVIAEIKRNINFSIPHP